MTNSENKILVDHVRKSGYQLNEFENSFLQTIEYLLKKDYRLTIKQAQCLVKLYGKCYSDY